MSQLFQKRLAQLTTSQLWHYLKKIDLNIDEISTDKRWKETHGGGTMHFFTLQVGNEVKPPKPKVVKPQVVKPKLSKSEGPKTLLELYGDDDIVNPWAVEVAEAMPLPEEEKEKEVEQPAWIKALVDDNEPNPLNFI